MWEVKDSKPKTISNKESSETWDMLMIFSLSQINSLDNI